MDGWSPNLLIIALWKVATLGAGLAIVWMGYRLLVKGIFPDEGTDLEATWKSVKVVVKRAAPGACFAIFGAVVMVMTVRQGLVWERSAAGPYEGREFVDGFEPSRLREMIEMYAHDEEVLEELLDDSPSESSRAEGEPPADVPDE